MCSFKIYIKTTIYFNPPIIFAGLTHSSYCSGVTYPRRTASSFNEVPLACAVFAISAAL